MSAEKNDKPPPPVIPRSLAPISPTNSICDPTIMDDHQRRVGDRTSPGRRHSSRKRDSPNFFVPTPFHPSLRLHGQGLRRGPGRPPKKRLDESSASQPLRRGPGRPQRKRSDAPTNAPEVVLPPPVPPTGLNQNIPEQVSMSTNSELVPPPPVPPTGSNENIPEKVSMSTNLKVNPLSRLETPKQTPSSQSQMPEKSKKVLTDKVQSVLVSYLTSGTTTSVDDMVNFANGAFSTLNWIGDDYGSFYEDVKNMISYKYNLFIAERDGDVCSVSELEKQRLDAVLRAYNIEKEIKHTRAKQEKDKENKEKSKKLIEDARGMIQRLEQVIPSLEQQVAAIEQDDEQKHRAAHRIAQAEVEKVSIQINEARTVQMDAERRRNEALQGIESTTRRLQSYVEER